VTLVGGLKNERQKMKLKIRMDSADSKFVHCSIFSDENNCGTYASLGRLCMTRYEYVVFTGVLNKGAKNVKGFKYSFDDLISLEKVIAKSRKGK